jgi:hypothetical protein
VSGAVGIGAGTGVVYVSKEIGKNLPTAIDNNLNDFSDYVVNMYNSIPQTICDVSAISASAMIIVAIAYGNYQLTTHCFHESVGYFKGINKLTKCCDIVRKSCTGSAYGFVAGCALMFGGITSFGCVCFIYERIQTIKNRNEAN